MRLSQPSILILLFATAATAACGCRLANDDVLHLGRKVETELPIGSTPAQITKFLDDLHIENGPGGVQVMDTHTYDGLQQVSGHMYSYTGGESAGNLFFFFRDGKLVEWWVASDCGGGCYFMRANKSSYKNTNAGLSDCYER